MRAVSTGGHEGSEAGLSESWAGRGGTGELEFGAGAGPGRGGAGLTSPSGRRSPWGWAAAVGGAGPLRASGTAAG